MSYETSDITCNECGVTITTMGTSFSEIEQVGGFVWNGKKILCGNCADKDKNDKNE